MKMTSDISNGSVVAEKGPLESVRSVTSMSSSGVKNRLTFSIDSLVGVKHEKDDRDQTKSSPNAFKDISKMRSRSPSPSPKRQCPQKQQSSQVTQQSKLTKTPPATGSTESSPISDQHQNQRFLHTSAFTSPALNPAMAAQIPAAMPGSRLWELATVDPASGWWKDTVAAASMYHAAAALYSAYPWCVPQVGAGPGDLVRKQPMMIQSDHTQMTMIHSPHDNRPEANQLQQNPSQTTSMMASGTGDQTQTFWHHHIAELLRQNGGHPVHHTRLYAGPEAGHAAANFLFAGCRKPKRIRTAFSPNQLMELEAAFEKNQYVVGNERKELARRLALTETQVKVWFQNRRTKAKRMKNEDVGDHGASSSSATSSTSATTKNTTTTTTAHNNSENATMGESCLENMYASKSPEGSGISSVLDDQEESDHEEEHMDTFECKKQEYTN